MFSKRVQLLWLFAGMMSLILLKRIKNIDNIIVMDILFGVLVVRILELLYDIIINSEG